MRSLLAIAVAILVWTPLGAADGVSASATAAARRRQRSRSDGEEIRTFDRLDRIGGHPTTVLGGPRVVETPVGNAIEFDGVHDALLVDAHPLAGADTFTCRRRSSCACRRRSRRTFSTRGNGVASECFATRAGAADARER